MQLKLFQMVAITSVQSPNFVVRCQAPIELYLCMFVTVPLMYYNIQLEFFISFGDIIESRPSMIALTKS